MVHFVSRRHLPVYDLRKIQSSTNAFDIINRVRPEQPLKDAGYKVDHDLAPLLLKYPCQFGENRHTLFVNHQSRGFRYGFRFRLDVLPEFCGQKKDRVRQD